MRPHRLDRLLALGDRRVRHQEAAVPRVEPGDLARLARRPRRQPFPDLRADRLLLAIAVHEVLLSSVGEHSLGTARRCRKAAACGWRRACATLIPKTSDRGQKAMRQHLGAAAGVLLAVTIAAAPAQANKKNDTLNIAWDNPLD